jgi:hypothetical protein
MAGYNLIQEIRRLEEDCDRLGLMMCHAKHFYNEFGDVVAVKPKDDEALPLYSRDAEVFIGTIKDLQMWLRGIEWARGYDGMIFGKNHDKNRTVKEEKYRAGQTFKRLLEGKESDKP